MASNGHGIAHPTVAPLTDPRALFYHLLLAQTFDKRCLCDSEGCAKYLYLNHPYTCFSCPSPIKIDILPCVRPHIIVIPRERHYEALQLARSSIRYFSRPRPEMDMAQTQAATEIGRWLHERGLIAKLGAPDPRDTVPVDEMRTLITHLLSVFFFGAAVRFEFTWETTALDTNDLLGVTEVKDRGGQEVECIAMHAITVTAIVGLSPDYTIALATQRLSTLMHELIHAVLRALCYKDCFASHENLAPHGRAWQRLAMGVEEVFARLFRLRLDLGRMQGVLSDMLDQGTWFNHPSRHDLEVYGFVNPLE